MKMNTSSLTVYQVSIFVCLYIGYFMYIINRRSFSFMIPFVIKKDQLSNDAIGTTLSFMATAYAIGKFLSGMLVDKLSSRIMFASGLLAAGITNLIFSTALPFWFPFIWFLNGLSQGPGWPACAKILRRWYSPKIFGTLWSSLSTSMNLPATVGPLLCSILISWYGGNWRPVMFLGGLASCAYAFVSLILVKDKPEDVGLTLLVQSCNDGDNNKLSEKQQLKSIDKSTPKPGTNVWIRILSSWYLYIISFGFLVSLFVKGVITDWGAIYLIQNKEAKNYFTGVFLAWLEVGGIFGSIFSGYASDKLVQKLGMTNRGNPRHYLYITLYLIILLCVYILRSIDNVKKNSNVLLVLATAIGFSVYGNISLCGVLAIENAADDISGTVHAFSALSGNVGLMIAGLPFSKLVGFLGWDAALQICELILLFAVGVFILAQTISCRIGYKEKTE